MSEKIGSRSQGSTVLLGVLSAAALSSASAAPYAVSGDTNDQPTWLDEIVVTARKRQQAIGDLAMTVNSFHGQDLRELGYLDLRDLGVIVPGLSVTDSGQGTPIYSMRGVGFNDTTYMATGTVGLYEDEVSLPYSAMSKGLGLDIDRVEVLKGPQGTLFGRNTTGGTINLLTKQPEDHFQMTGRVSYARFRTTDAESVVTGPMLDNLSGRLALRMRRRDAPWQHSNTRPEDEIGKAQQWSGRGILAWNPSSELALRLTLNTWSDRSEPQAPQVVGINPQNGIVGEAALSPEVRDYPLVPLNGADLRVADWYPQHPWQRNDGFASQALRLSWQLPGKLEAVGIASHLRVRADDSGNIQSGFDVYNAESETTARIDTQQLELRLSRDEGTWLWILGANTGRDSGFESHHFFNDTLSLFFPSPTGHIADSPDTANPILPLPGFSGSVPAEVLAGGNALGNRFITQGQAKIDNAAAFADLEWSLSRRWRLNLGARLSDSRQRYTGCSKEANDSEGVGVSNLFTALSARTAAQYTANTGKPGEPSIGQRGKCFTLAENGSMSPYVGHLQERGLSGRVALDWSINSTIMTYFSWSKGFKAGGFPVLNASAQDQFWPTRQEQLSATELGFRLRFWDRKARASGALYYYDYRDKQLLTKQLDEVFGPLPVLRNAPRSHVIGAELELTARPWQRALISLHAAGMRTQIDEFFSTDDSGELRDFAGRPFNFAPDLQLSLRLHQAWMFRGLRLAASADLQFSSNSNGTLAGTAEYELPSYALFGAQLAISSPGGLWELQLFGRNLGNSFYSLGSFNVGDGVARLAGRPRGAGLSFSWSWE